MRFRVPRSASRRVHGTGGSGPQGPVEGPRPSCPRAGRIERGRRSRRRPELVRYERDSIIRSNALDSHPKGDSNMKLRINWSRFSLLLTVFLAMFYVAGCTAAWLTAISAML